MTISLNIELESGFDDYVNEYKIKTDNLLYEIGKINEQMSIKYNYIVIPISIYNIIECSDYFISHNHEFKIEDSIRKVGRIGEFECYLDIYLPPNEILVSWDKATSRNIKIDSLLLNKKLEKEKKIKLVP